MSARANRGGCRLKAQRCCSRRLSPDNTQETQVSLVDRRRWFVTAEVGGTEIQVCEFDIITGGAVARKPRM